MGLSFRNILIPVDFTVNTEFAVKNALVLADVSDPVIHLFHVENKEHSTPSTNNCKARLLQIKENIREQTPEIQVDIHIFNGGTVQANIIKAADILKPDLIIIGKHNGNNWLTFLNTTNSSLIARKTNCAVLNIRTGKVLNKIRSVVMPLRFFVPERKMELLPALTRKQKPIIHLVTVQNKHVKSPDAKVFIDTYRNLSRNLHYPVNHKLITGNNYAKKIMKYAMAVDADIIMVNPFDETAISPFWGKQISDMRLNVLTVAPATVK